ncbi:MAG TPA: hypothetical protein VN797_01110 [Gemmatimonadaceae bacterium]|nr:hypothetical protein [Thermoanaerobaculia bacterium]HXQ76769.1 hypothetical protein [Gemmatimonadaceae bacterium]
MVDNTNPTNQFHPYQPPEERKQPLAGNGFGDVLNTTWSKARESARSNPGVLLGGLAAAAIGAGLLRKKRMS